MRVDDHLNLIRQFFRVTYRCSAVAVCIGCCVSESLCRIILGRKDARSRQETLHKWTGWLLKRLAVEVNIVGAPPSHGLIVANHLSYLDILVFSAVVPCSFVSKREIKTWPGLGWAASLTGTVFIDRARSRAAHAIQPQINATLCDRACLVLFPEGTSTDGSSLLPFHPPLLQPVLAAGAPITAARISYEFHEGDPRLEVCYWGEMTLVPHAMKLFRKNGVKAHVRFGERSRIFQNRKQAARELWEEVNTLVNQPRSSTAVTEGMLVP